MKLPTSNYIKAITLLVSCTIGAGILSLPYFFSNQHVFSSLLVIIFVYIIILLPSIYLGKLLLKEKENTNIVGIAKKYLGKNSNKLMIISYFIYILGAILVYTIGSGSILHTFIPVLSEKLLSIFFIGIGSIILYSGINLFANTEELIVIILIICIAIISISSFMAGDIQNILLLQNNNIDSTSFLFPIGGLLFALTGFMAIPDMKNILKKKKHLLTKTIIAGVTICIIIYSLFIISTIYLNGGATTPVATIGIAEKLGTKITPFINAFALFAMFSSFLALAHSMKDSLHYDYNISKFKATSITILIPVILFLISKPVFQNIIAFIGIVTGTIQIVLILEMYKNYLQKKDTKGKKLPNNKTVLIETLMLMISIIGIIAFIKLLF